VAGSFARSREQWTAVRENDYKKSTRRYFRLPRQISFACWVFDLSSGLLGLPLDQLRVIPRYFADSLICLVLDMLLNASGLGLFIGFLLVLKW